MIAIALMPETWKDYVLNVPGIFSSEAFTYLHHIYLDKVGRHQDTDGDLKKQVAALFAEQYATHVASPTTPKSKRPICTNPMCPSKVGHTTKECWAKGGGGEGKVPKSWKDKYGPDSTKVSTSDTFSPIDIYVGSAYSPKTTSGMSASLLQTSDPPDTPIRVSHALLGRGEEQQGRGVDNPVPDPHPLVISSQCTACKIENTPLYSTKWYEPVRTFIDSSATDHCWVRQEQFIKYADINKKGRSTVAGDIGQFLIKALGTVEFAALVEGAKRLIRLLNVKHMPEFAHNLISLSTLDKEGYHGEWGDSSVVVKTKEGKTMMVGTRRGRMYEVDVLYGNETEVNSARSQDKAIDILTWHQQLGHVAIPRILQMSNRNLVNGLRITSKEVYGLCEACLYSKAKRRAFDKNLEH